MWSLTSGNKQGHWCPPLTPGLRARGEGWGLRDACTDLSPDSEIVDFYFPHPVLFFKILNAFFNNQKTYVAISSHMLFRSWNKVVASGPHSWAAAVGDPCWAGVLLWPVVGCRGEAGGQQKGPHSYCDQVETEMSPGPLALQPTEQHGRW